MQRTVTVAHKTHDSPVPRRLRAMHRLARSRRGVGYLVASVAQGVHADYQAECHAPTPTDHNVIHHIEHMLGAGAENALHIALLYLSYTLL